MAKANSKKREEWKLRLAEWKRSEKSITQWCRERELSYHTFIYWRDRLEKWPTNPQKGAFIEIGDKAPENKGGIVVTVGNASIALSPDFDEPTFSRAVVALGRCL